MTDQDQQSWQRLHDATLVDLHLDWKSGALTINLRVGSPRQGTVQLRGSDLTLLDCPRQFPWGKSISINNIRGPIHTPDGERLEIEVQSGDILVVIAGSITTNGVTG